MWENGEQSAPGNGLRLRGPAEPPALPTRVGDERCGLGSAGPGPTHSPSELLGFAATSSFYRFGCAERRGYYRSKPVLSLLPRPLPGLCLCSSVTLQESTWSCGPPLKPATRTRPAALGWGGACCRLHGVRGRCSAPTARAGPDLPASDQRETGLQLRSRLESVFRAAKGADGIASSKLKQSHLFSPFVSLFNQGIEGENWRPASLWTATLKSLSSF